MVEFLSTWAKQLVLAVIIISILEMLLPNNKTKKYIRMIMGIYLLFTMISPLIENKEVLDINEFTNLENIVNQTTIQTSTEGENSMDKRIQQLYIEELEKDIKEKVENQGYEVEKCIVDAIITGNEEESGISKITLKIGGKNIKETETKDLENRIVTEIQKIKKVDTSISEKKDSEEKIEKSDIEELKKFIIQENGVSEECLEIN